MKKLLFTALVLGLFAAGAAWAKVGGGNITFSVKGASDVVYSHDVHVTTQGLKCTNCHYAIYRMTTLQQHYTMSEMQKGMSCGACHNGTRAFDVARNCNRCHK